MGKIILMINGKKRSGKDYFSDILVSKGYTKIALAKKLKDAACAAADIEYDNMEDMKNTGGKFSINYKKYSEDCKQALLQSAAEIGADDEIVDMIMSYDYHNLIPMEDDKDIDGNVIFDARVFLQEIGALWKKVFHNDNIWTDLLVSQIRKMPDKKIVVSDYRYPYEATGTQDAFPDAIVKTVKVLGKNLYDRDKYDTHSSETALNDAQFDYHINNTFWHDSSLYWQAIGLMQTVEELKEIGK